MSTPDIFRLYLAAFGLLAGGSLVGLGASQAFVTVSEKTLSRVLGTAMVALLGLSGALLVASLGDPTAVHVLTAGDAGPVRAAVPLAFTVNAASALLLFLANAIIAAVGNFSVRYLHREKGFVRFFFFYLLFLVGITLAILGRSLALMVTGWELVGVSSVMLIGFFLHRKGPTDNARLAFNLYRAADVALMLALALLASRFHGMGLSAFLDPAAPATAAGGDHATLVALFLVLVAVSVKSAQVPFTPWLAYAMEGPTSSSAIFYGALSVHLGPFLLLRLSPFLHALPLWTAGLVTVGALTVVVGASSGRARSDVKGQLAYASAVQVGFILIEIGMGWNLLAYGHMISHLVLRTLQFLTTPSYVQIRQRWQKAVPAEPRGWLADLARTGWGKRAYALALREFGLLDFLRKGFGEPITHAGHVAAMLECRLQRAMGLGGGSPGAEASEWPCEPSGEPVQDFAKHVKGKHA